MRKVLIFKIGESRFGLDLPKVIDIRKAGALETESSTGPRIRARTSEGKALIMYDMAMLLNRNGARGDDPRDSQLMVIKDGEVMIGLKVDSVSRVISVDDDLFEGLPPVFGNTALSCFPLIIKYEDTLIPMIDPVGIQNYEIVIQEVDSDRLDMAQTHAPVDEFDIIELTEVVGTGDEVEGGGAPAELESADEFLETLDSSEEADDALIPMMEDPSGLPPAEIIKPGDVETQGSEHPLRQWNSFLPDNEDDLESFFVRMVNEERISRMILRIVHRFAETAVRREIVKLKDRKAFFPNAAGNALNSR